jgi:hypothetical protein
MMAQQEQAERGFLDSMKVTFNVLMFLARIISLPLELMLHVDVGERYLGLSGGFAFLLMIFFPALFPHSNPTPLLLLLIIFLGRCFIHHVASIRTWWSGRLTKHTRRPGTPLALWLFPTLPEAAVRWLEPVCVVLIGAVISLLSRPLGAFLFLSGAGMLACLALSYIMMMNRVRDMHDRMLEQQATGDRLRELQGR